MTESFKNEIKFCKISELRLYEAVVPGARLFDEVRCDDYRNKTSAKLVLSFLYLNTQYYSVMEALNIKQQSSSLSFLLMMKHSLLVDENFLKLFIK